jgi:drug/metabolite transporter (DMT)-like permease
MVLFSQNIRGALFMSVSTVGFTANDALTKTVSETMNAGQMMLVRGFFATILIALLAWRWGAFRAARSLLHPTVAVRVLGEVGSTLFFLTALSHMHLANISAVLQALPLAVTVGAAFFLGEPVGWRRWAAISVGFVGVLLVVRPGFAGFNSYSTYALGCVLFCAFRDLATRKMPSGLPSLLVSTATAAAVTVAGGLLVVPLGGWAPLDIADTSMLAAAAVLLLFGYQFVIMSLREGEISFIAPFRYMALLWAIALGFLFFGDLPDKVTLTGSAIIVGSGLYALYREQIVGRRTPIAAATRPAMAPDGT